ncbi:hypothetical protein, partial [Arthrobacter sp. YAF16]|uniref:hypothetical protein n=1 Tax=Arthrobacter sp. YAF16 TaxID=3233076 RepID=UPI003F8DAD77
MKNILDTVRAKTRPGVRPARTKTASAARTKHRKNYLTATGLVAAAAVLVTGAIIYPGFKTAEVELNDGGVWVVSKAKNAVGRLNYPSRVLDGAVT